MISVMKDPVCGMMVAEDNVATRVTHHSTVFYFCSRGCGDRFRRDPSRYLGGGMNPNGSEAAWRRGEGAGEAPARACPECGAEVAAASEAVLGNLTVSEFATMVRHRWRQRLGRRAYRRAHSDRLIRALALHALTPESPVARVSAQEELRREIARLRADGLNRAQTQRELYHLSRAAAEVLVGAGLDRARTAWMIEMIDGELVSLIEWKDNVPREEAWAP